MIKRWEEGKCIHQEQEVEQSWFTYGSRRRLAPADFYIYFMYARTRLTTSDVVKRSSLKSSGLRWSIHIDGLECDIGKPKLAQLQIHLDQFHKLKFEPCMPAKS